MEVHDTVRRLLQHELGAAICDACLALACHVSLSDMRSITEQLVQSSAMFQRESTCTNCGRTVPSTMSASAQKCAHCSQPLLGGEATVKLEDDIFHDTCLRRLLTEETIRFSRALSRRSRELIAQSRRRIGLSEPNSEVSDVTEAVVPKLIELVRDKLDAGTLPCNDPRKLWAGTGSGKACSACGEPILRAQTELEPQYDDNRPVVLFHLGCHGLWEAERRRRGGWRPRPGERSPDQ